MSNYYSNPTANAALGTVERELQEKKKRARHVARLYRMGLLTLEDLRRESRYFTGIYSRVLRDAVAPKKKKQPDAPAGASGSALVGGVAGYRPDYARSQRKTDCIQ